MTLIAATLQAFFTDRLARQRQASPRTIAAYRDALRLLLIFVPFIPGLRDLPRWVPIHKLIWRRHYASMRKR